jgi:acyl transferase domain-containing protein
MNTAKLGVLSPTSACHTFDASADGYGRAEGAGALYVRRLSDAIRDGNPIRGVIRATAVNA